MDEVLRIVCPEEETPDSDLDVLVAVKERDPEVERSIRDAAYRVMWDYNFHPLISLKILSQEEIEERRRLNSSFLEIIEREGVNPVQGSSGP